MISSVACRRALPDEAAPWCDRSSGSPKATVNRRRRGTLEPTGCSSSVPIRPTGTTGAPLVSASQATPVRPR
ncbi:hypothetical protein [Frigoribacterium faeni]